MMDFDTWLLDKGYDRILRMWKYKRMFTPYEQKEAFSDESLYVSNEAMFIKIKEAVELPDGDIMIGYVICDPEPTDFIEYVRLSEIDLAYFPSDAEEDIL